MTTPTQPGWYWYLPSPGHLTMFGPARYDQPVVLLVGASKATRDMPPATLVVRFPQGTLSVSEMPGDWERIAVPPKMRTEAMRRQQEVSP